jgi:hypothetical protein
MKATKGGNFKAVPLPEPQTAFARCYSVIDIGTIPNLYFNKPVEDKPFIHKINVTWEFPGLLAVFNEEKGEQPFVIGQELTLSTGEKSNLSKLISQWRNKPLTAEEEESFDPSTMVGKTCFISFIHTRKEKYKGKEIKLITNENTNLKFNGIMPKPKDVESKPNINPYFIWDWDKIAETGWDKENFEKIPKWLQKKMATSKEYQKYAPKDYKIDSQDDDQPEAEENAKTVKDEW